MRPLLLTDIESIPAYEAQRDITRRRIIALKKQRRVTLGPRVSLVFENWDTMKFQVQEMCRIEHISEPRLVQQEIDVYNDLLPEGRAVGATLLIELVQTDDMPAILRDLSGLEEAVYLRFGSREIHAEAERGRSTEEKTSTVHYLTFRFESDDPRELADAGQVGLALEHPNYRHHALLAKETVVSLVQDLLTQ